ncbi:MAG: GH92 family glycosyl hydrolase [Actinomycetota bacterium]
MSEPRPPARPLEVDEVVIRQGTASTRDFSNGNTLPLFGVPFGMTHWAAETGPSPWFHHPAHRRLRGVRATRQPSPWIGDYGEFRILPQTGQTRWSPEARATAFDPEAGHWAPDRLALALPREQCELELTATARCAVLRVRFTGPAGPRRLIVDGGARSSRWRIEHPPPTGGAGATTTVRGVVGNNRGGVPDGFGVDVVLRLDVSVRDLVAVPPDDQPDDKPDAVTGCMLELPPDTAEVELRIGTSFLSADQADRNVDLELGDEPIGLVRERVRAAWNELLGTVAVVGADRTQRATLASALYRCFLFPRPLDEPTPDGRRHRSPYDGEVHDGPLYADNGFWDTHRTVYPLFSLLCPDRLADMAEGWVNAYREGGWFPKWASPGYRDCMIGTHIDAVLADAYVKGIPFDADTALVGLRRHAYEDADGTNRHGRLGLADYRRLGWVPADRVPEATSRTMDFAYNDWCIARIAAGLGDDELAADLDRRAGNYRHVFDPEVGFMRGRNADGSWRVSPVDPSGFSPIEWGDPFVEGGAWQCGWAIPHDVPGLIELHGGADRFIARLEELLATPPRFEVGSYGHEIHEMSEMAAADFGQYAHSNQPSHHLLFLFALAGRPDLTQYWVRRVVDELYAPTVDGLAGDEDNGELSAWYVFGVLGWYPHCPGDPSYVLATPRFDRIELRPEGDRPTIVVEAVGPDGGLAPGQDLSGPYIRSWEVDGRPHQAPVIDHGSLVAGATVRAIRSPTVNR